MKNNEIPVYCWNCGKRFYIEIKNIYAGDLFCSDKCRAADLKEWYEKERIKFGIINKGA